MPHPAGTGLRRCLAESLGGDAVPDLADAREARWQRLRVRLQLLVRWRIVERTVDPDGAKQWIARVLLEPLGRLRTAIAAVGKTSATPGRRHAGGAPAANW